MPKAKAQKEAKNAKSHLKARLEYLQRAAEYLHNTAINTDRTKNPTAETHPSDTTGTNAGQPVSQNVDISNGTKPADLENQRTVKKPLTNLARVTVSHMRGVSLKTQTRLPVPVKRSYCKKCDTLLTPGVSCEHEIQNASRERKKSWADVLVIRCLVCRTEKRFPQTDRRSRKLPERQAMLKGQQSGDIS